MTAAGNPFQVPCPLLSSFIAPQSLLSSALHAHFFCCARLRTVLLHSFIFWASRRSPTLLVSSYFPHLLALPLSCSIRYSPFPQFLRCLHSNPFVVFDFPASLFLLCPLTIVPRISLRLSQAPDAPDSSQLSHGPSGQTPRLFSHPRLSPQLGQCAYRGVLRKMIWSAMDRPWSSRIQYPR